MSLIANFISNWRKVKTFLLRPGMRPEYPPSPLLLSKVLKFLARGIGKGKKRYTNRKGRCQIIPICR
jgi:hypothetical protein